MAEIRIRAREPGDAEALAEITRQPRVIWGTMQMPYQSVAFHQKRMAETPTNQVHVVATLDGEVVGAAHLGLNEHRRRAHAANLGMAVHDAHAGKGIGRALLAALLEHADLWLNLKRVELTVWTDNARAIALYEQFGFEREGVHRTYAWREGAYADALFMARVRP